MDRRGYLLTLSRGDSVRTRKVQNVISERQLNLLGFGVSSDHLSLSLYGDVVKSICECTINCFHVALLTLTHTARVVGVARS